MKIGIDIDGVITENSALFEKLTALWDDDIYIITYRREESRQDTIDLLEELGICYTKLFMIGSFAEKAEVIKANKIRLYIDDQPEILQFIDATDSDCSVLLFRNEGNYDAKTRQWIFSSKTAKLLF